jgi:hypothetical protein
MTILGDRVLVDNVGQWNVRGRHPSWFDCNKEMSHNVTIVFQPGVVVQGIDGTFVRFFYSNSISNNLMLLRCYS